MNGAAAIDGAFFVRTERALRALIRIGRGGATGDRGRANPSVAVQAEP